MEEWVKLANIPKTKEKEMGGVDKLKSKTNKKVSSGCSQMCQLNRYFLWRRDQGQ